METIAAFAVQPSSVDLDDLPVGILYIELGLERAGEIAAVNATACRLFGQPRDALVGRSGPALLQLGLDRWRALLGVVAQGGIADSSDCATAWRATAPATRSCPTDRTPPGCWPRG
jgi:PAS domain-containing protein